MIEVNYKGLKPIIKMAASGRAVRSNSKTTGMNVDAEVWQPREKVLYNILTLITFENTHRIMLFFLLCLHIIHEILILVFILTFTVCELNMFVNCDDVPAIDHWLTISPGNCSFFLNSSNIFFEIAFTFFLTKNKIF